MCSNPPASCNQHTARLHSCQPRFEHQKQKPSKEESARDLHVKTGEGTVKPEGLVHVHTVIANPGNEARVKFDLLPAVAVDFRQEFRHDY